MNANEYILNRINNYFRLQAINKHQELLGDCSYQYYQSDLNFIQEALDIIEESEGSIKGKSFIDLGSGLGNVCAYAARRGLISHGIEINPILFNLSQQFYPEVTFYNQDILEFNKFQEFDIIFYYLPIYNQELQQSFRKKVEDNMVVGQYLVQTECDGLKDNRFLSLFKNKIKNQV